MEARASGMSTEKRREKNIKDGARIKKLAGDYVELRVAEISGQKKPEIVTAELDRLTTELTDLLINDDVSPQRRDEIKKEVSKASFEEFFTFRMVGKKEFNQTRVALVDMVIYEKSEKKWDADTRKSFGNVMKASPKAKPISLTP